MKKNMFTIIGVAVGLLFWFIEGALHYFVFGDKDHNFIPQDPNELWMRCVIVLLIIFINKETIDQRKATGGNSYI